MEPHNTLHADAPLRTSGPASRKAIDDALRLDPAAVAARIEPFIREAVDRFQRGGVILGMSGGVDSALVATLACRALGPDKVHTLLLPERDSSPESRTDAQIECRRLGIDHREVNIAPMLEPLGIYRLVPLRILGLRSVKAAVVQSQHRSQTAALGEMPFRAGLLGTRDLGSQKQLINAGNAYARAKHRQRLLTLYYYADLENLLVLGTTNRSESMSGFVVKWGDNVADIEPILPLYKTQVWALARHLGVTQHIIDKAPSPDLIPGIVDTTALGIDYETMDRISVGLDQGWEVEAIAEAAGATPEQVVHVREMRQRSAHLRTLPPVPDLA
jgi:NAD+ synthase